MKSQQARENIRIFFLWSVIFVLTRIFFIYYPHHGEPDIYRISMGIYYNALTGDGLFGNFLYGRSFSFGYYFLIFKIISIFPFFLKGLELLLFIISFISCFFIIYFIISLFSRFKPSKINLNIFMALWILSPVWWECTTYSHPIIPATALSLGAAVCLRNAYYNNLWIKSLLYFILSSVLFFFSFSFRAEVMLITPALFLLCVEFKNKGKMFLSAGSILLAVASFFIIQNYIIASNNISISYSQNKAFSSSFTLLFNYLKQWVFNRYADIGLLIKGIASAVFASGIVSILWVPFGLYYLIKNKFYKCLITVTLLVGPSLLFWLPNSIPFRHFLLVAIGLSLISSFCFSFFKRNTAVIFLIITITGNFLLPELLYKPIVKRYTFNYPNLAQISGRTSGQIPVGCPILNHIANRKIFEYTDKEFNYFSKLNENYIVFIGYNRTVLETNLTKNSKNCTLKYIDDGIEKFSIDNKNLYFISTEYFPKSDNNLFKNIIQRMGNEYNKNFFWYMNPIMQPRASLSSNIPNELKLIKPFSNSNSQ